MTTQRPDGAQIGHPCHTPPRQHLSHSYYTEVLAKPIDEQSRQVSQLIDLAFDTPGVRHLDVRVIGADADPAALTVPSTSAQKG